MRHRTLDKARRDPGLGILGKRDEREPRLLAPTWLAEREFFNRINDLQIPDSSGWRKSQENQPLSDFGMDYALAYLWES